MKNAEVKKVQDAVITNLKARNNVKIMSDEGKVEFLAGAMTVLHAVYKTEEEAKDDKLSAAIPPYWVIAIMSGMVNELLQDEKSPEGETVH